MPVPCIAAGACFTATMAALGDCNVDVSHGIDVEEGRINNDQDADAEGRSPTKGVLAFNFKEKHLKNKLPETVRIHPFNRRYQLQYR